VVEPPRERRLRNTELSGPSRVEARADFPHHTIWNVHGACQIDLTYPGDVRVSVSDKHPNGLKFIGDEGWIWRRAGPGSVIFNASNRMHCLRNAGNSAATHHVINWKSH
jgi:hypothetical protein